MIISWWSWLCDLSCSRGEFKGLTDGDGVVIVLGEDIKEGVNVGVFGERVDDTILWLDTIDFWLCDVVIIAARIDFGRGGNLGFVGDDLCHGANLRDFLLALVDPGREGKGDCAPVAAKWFDNFKL